MPYDVVVDRDAAAAAIESFLRAIGHEPTGELANTPALVAQAWCEDLLSGQGTDPVGVLRESTAPIDTTEGPVMLRNIAAATMCPHHLMPAHGRADVAYLPGQRVAGLGAVARAVRAVCHRLVLQESACNQIAAALVGGLEARASACRLRLTHTCLVARGERESGAVVETIAFAGGNETERMLLLSALSGSNPNAVTPSVECNSSAPPNADRAATDPHG